MAVVAFPSVELANEHGVLAAGGDLEPESLLLAYSSGIFPWPVVGHDLLWFSPPQRAILYSSDFHLSRSLKKTISKTPFEFKINQNCLRVISGCQSMTNRPKQQGTWITEEMKEAYMELHRLGFVHSFECYFKGELVGGVYGVAIGGAFAAESMFYRQTDASKVILWILSQYLLAQDVKWIDCQIVNPHLLSLGVVEIPREQFLVDLKLSLAKPNIEFSSKRLRALLSSLEILKSSE